MTSRGRRGGGREVASSSVLEVKALCGALTIGQLARMSGLPVTTIRYYEAIGVMPAADRRGGRREYGDHSLQIARILAVGRAVGLEIEAQKRLGAAIASGPDGARAFLGAYERVLGARQADLTRRRKRLRQALA
eukprot:gene36476-59594_t